jgi:transcriptional regulator with XRE-family HTH domain
MLPLILKTPQEIALELAQRVKKLRLDRVWTQEELAGRAGIALATYQYFERSGRISLERLLKLALVLDARDGFEGLFSSPELDSLEELERLSESHTRRRGRRSDAKG